MVVDVTMLTVSCIRVIKLSLEIENEISILGVRGTNEEQRFIKK